MMTDVAPHMLGHVSIKAEMKVVLSRNESHLSFYSSLFPLSCGCFSQYAHWQCSRHFERLRGKCQMCHIVIFFPIPAHSGQSMTTRNLIFTDEKVCV